MADFEENHAILIFNQTVDLCFMAFGAPSPVSRVQPVDPGAPAGQQLLQNIRRQRDGAIIDQGMHMDECRRLHRSVHPELHAPLGPPLTMARGLTAPGRMPRNSISRSSDPKETLPAPIAAPSALRSTARSCSSTTR